jgi:hypothetical protein
MDGDADALEPSRAAIGAAIAAVSTLPEQARARNPPALARLEAVSIP